MSLEYEHIKGKKLIIFGAGIIARATIITLQELYGLDKIDLLGCVVTSPNKNPKDIEGVRVYSYKEMLRQHKDALVLVAVKDMFINDVEALLAAEEVENYDRVFVEECIPILEQRLKESAFNKWTSFQVELNRNRISKEEYIIFLCKQLRKDLLVFEVNLVDHCNLNCQCCNHFSPLAKETFLDVEQYERDLVRIKELYGDKVVRLMLLGGEPLLHTRLIEIMQISRKILDKTSIYVFTNGLLFPSMPEEFWENCRSLDIGIKVTKYPLNFDYEKWQIYATERGVDLSDENPEPIKTTYRLPLVEEGNLDPYFNYMKCYHANQCIVLKEGRLYTCPLAAYVHHFNQYFNKHIPEGDVNSIDIYDLNSCEEIDAFLKTPIPMCKHCDICNYQYDIPWKTTRRELEEWMCQEE